MFSLYGSRQSILSATEFSFDEELINTRVYREALARSCAKHGRDSLTRSSEATTVSKRGSTVTAAQEPGMRTTFTQQAVESYDPFLWFRPGDTKFHATAYQAESTENLQPKNITAEMGHLYLLVNQAAAHAQIA